MIDVLMPILMMVGFAICVPWLQRKIHEAAPPLSDCTGTFSLFFAMTIWGAVSISIIALVKYFMGEM